MSELSKYFTNAFSHSYKSKTPDEYVFQRGDYRFSVLSSRIIRVEKTKTDFTDEATQTVICRDFDRPQFGFSQDNNKIVIKQMILYSVLTFQKAKQRALRSMTQDASPTSKPATSRVPTALST